MIAWLAAVTLGLGFVAALVARAKGRSFFVWLAYGALLGVIAVPHALLLRDRRGEQDWQFSRFGFPGPSRACPNCGAMVYPEAVVCRRCRHPLYHDHGATNVNGAHPHVAGGVSAMAASGAAAAAGSSNSAAFAWLDDAFSRVAMDDDSPVVGRRRGSRASWDKASSREEGVAAFDDQSQSPGFDSAEPDPTLGTKRREADFTAASAGAGKRGDRDDWIPMDFSPTARGEVRLDRRAPVRLLHASRIAVGALIAAIVLFVTWRTAPLFPELLTWTMWDRRSEPIGRDAPTAVTTPNVPPSSREPQAWPLRPPEASLPRPTAPGDNLQDSASPTDNAASAEQAEPSLEIDKLMPPVAGVRPAQKTVRPAPDPELLPPREEGSGVPSSETGATTSSEFIAAVEKVLRESRGGARPSRSASGVTASGEIVILVQKRLQQRGYNPGAPDGRAGPQTQMAIRAFQRDAGMKPDGEIDMILLQRLGIVGEQIFLFGGESRRTAD